MGDIFQLAYIVPKISTVANVEAVQAAVHAYLLDKKIIQPELELDYYGMDYYPLDVGFLDVMRSVPSAKQNYFEQVLGVFYVNKRHSFFDEYLAKITCPSCQESVGQEVNVKGLWGCDDHESAIAEMAHEGAEVIYPMMDEWEAGQDEIACPTCGKKHEMNQYVFESEAVFSNFALAFVEGVSCELRRAFLQDLQAIIGHELIELDYSE